MWTQLFSACRPLRPLTAALRSASNTHRLFSLLDWPMAKSLCTPNTLEVSWLLSHDASVHVRLMSTVVVTKHRAHTKPTTDASYQRDCGMWTRAGWCLWAPSPSTVCWHLKTPCGPAVQTKWLSYKQPASICRYRDCSCILRMFKTDLLMFSLVFCDTCVYCYNDGFMLNVIIVFQILRSAYLHVLPVNWCLLH